MAITRGVRDLVRAVAVLAVALAAAIAQTLVKASLDSILQRDIPEETRSSAFAFSETIHQLALVIGGLIGLALSLTSSGLTGLTVAAVGLALALCWLLLARRHRILRSTRPGPAAHDAAQACATEPASVRTPGRRRLRVSTAAIFFASRLSGCLDRR